MKLDPARSKLAIFTYAAGLFGSLAHDLELTVTGLSGELTAPTVALTVPSASIAVVGVIKRGALDTQVLSAADRATIEKQVREDLFHGGSLQLTGTLRQGQAVIDVAWPGGKSQVTCPVTATTDRAQGAVELSMKALGLPTVKGPLGAFRVADRVRVTFDLAFS